MDLSPQPLNLGSERIQAFLVARDLNVVLRLLPDHRLHSGAGFDLAGNDVLELATLFVDDARVFALHLRNLALRLFRLCSTLVLLLDQIGQFRLALTETRLDTGHAVQGKLVLLLECGHLVFTLPKLSREFLSALDLCTDPVIELSSRQH